MRPGDWAALGLVAEAFLIDAFLIEGGHDPISTCVRRSWLAKAAVIGLSAHLLTHLPFDPISALGRAYSTWRHP